MCDIYKVGSNSGFDYKAFNLIVACAMTCFTICESTLEQNARTFAKALMKIALQFGLPQTIIVDKDSKFFGTFRDMTQLLKINFHII